MRVKLKHGLVIMLCLILATSVTAPAFAGHTVIDSAGNVVIDHSSAVSEPGDLYDPPEADPKPGDPDYANPVVPPQPEGMTDEELKKVDPLHYLLLKKYDKIEEKKSEKRYKDFLSSSGITYKPGKKLNAEELLKANKALEKLAKESSKTSVDAKVAGRYYYSYLVFKLTRLSSGAYGGHLTFRYQYRDLVTGVWSSWSSVGWEALSGNNNPYDQSKAGVGPIPDADNYAYVFGYVNGAWQGYVPDTGASFNPGKWRLDPWNGAWYTYNRKYLEVHGGNTFQATQGCIRLRPANISSLKWYYDNWMDNKKSSPMLYVDYGFTWV